MRKCTICEKALVGSTTDNRDHESRCEVEEMEARASTEGYTGWYGTDALTTQLKAGEVKFIRGAKRTSRGRRGGGALRVTYGSFAPKWVAEIYDIVRECSSDVVSRVFKQAVLSEDFRRAVFTVKELSSIHTDEMDAGGRTALDVVDGISGLVGYIRCDHPMHPAICMDAKPCCDRVMTLRVREVFFEMSDEIGRPKNSAETASWDARQRGWKERPEGSKSSDS